MKLSDLSDNWPKAAALVILTAILFWAYGCPPTTESLIHPEKKITRPELQIELDSITATAEFRFADLERQEHFRDLVLKNALVIIETGTLNPVGILTGLAALYGIGTGIKQTKDKIVRKKNARA